MGTPDVGDRESELVTQPEGHQLPSSAVVPMHNPDAQVPSEVARGLVIFTQPHCPFCIRVKRLMEQLGVQPQYFDFNEHAAEYQKTLEATKHDTLPLVMYNGELMGGCDDVCSAVETGEFQRRLNLPSMNAVIPADGERKPPIWPGLFMFPPVANRWVAQGVAIQVVAISIIIIIWRKDAWAQWVCLAMALDFLVRLIAGGPPSMLGAAMLPIAAFLPEVLVPGPPKQFAALIGLFFFGFATILFHAGHRDTSWIGGSILVGIVTGFAFLEGFLNFCFGCYFFGLMNRFGLIPDTVYQPYTDTIGMYVYSVADQNRKQGWTPYHDVAPNAIVCDDKALLGWRRRLGRNDQPVPVPVRVRQATHASGIRSGIDFDYKFPKTDATVREHWGFEYIQPDDFGMPLGIAGFAAALRATSAVLYVPHQAYETVALIAGILEGVMLVLYLLKLVLYPRKVYSDYQHPFKRNSFVIIPITLLVFVYLLQPDPLFKTSRANMQEVVFWAGIVLYSICLIFSLYGWIRNRISVEQVNPSYLFPAAGALVVALVAPLIAPRRGLGFIECGFWYLGLGLFFFVIFFAITFGHGITYHWSDDRLRPLVAFWMAGAFLSQVSYQAVTGNGFDTVAFLFFAVGVFLFLVNILLVYPGRWLLRGRFEMANWALTFPLDVFVFAAVNYHAIMGHAFSLGVLWVSLVFAGWANYTMFWYTVALLVSRKWPRASVKWGPLSFKKLQHEAMRAIIPRMQADARQATPLNPESAAAYQARLLSQWSDYARFVETHNKYEADFMFPEVKGFNAKQIAAAEAQHAVVSAQVRRIHELIRDSQIEYDLQPLKDALIEHGDTMIDHVQWEEDHMQPLIRKHTNLAIQIDITRRVWASIPPADMEHTVVMVVRNLPMHGQRARFVKALLWALPERAQEIGGWLYRGLARDPLGDMKYQLIVEDVPEIVPRGTSLTGWTRAL